MAMERDVLTCLDYNISLPTRIYFLNRFLLAAQVEDGSSQNNGSGATNKGADNGRSSQSHQHAITERNYKEASFAYYLMDITLQNYGFNQYPMSLVAAAIVHYVKQVYRALDEVIWTHTLAFYTGYEEQDLMPVVYAIQLFHTSIFSSGYISILKKYNCQEYRFCSCELSLSKDRIRFDDNESNLLYLHQEKETEKYENIGLEILDDEDELLNDDVSQSEGPRDRVNSTPTPFLDANSTDAEGGAILGGKCDYHNEVELGFVDYTTHQEVVCEDNNGTTRMEGGVKNEEKDEKDEKDERDAHSDGYNPNTKNEGSKRKRKRCLGKGC
jgi:hypothetical protein